MGAVNYKVVEDNTNSILELEDKVNATILEIIGMRAEKYAKARCPVGTAESTGIQGYRGGTLRNSITYDVDKDAKTVSIGTNVEYAPYVELGTGPFFNAPPKWENFDAQKGSGVGKGYVKARPFLRPAIEDHLSEYIDIIKKIWSGV